MCCSLDPHLGVRLNSSTKVGLLNNSIKADHLKARVEDGERTH
jgi:hypothetical protein